MTEYEQRVRNLVQELQMLWSLTECFCECREMRKLRQEALSRHAAPEGKLLKEASARSMLVSGPP